MRRWDPRSMDFICKVQVQVIRNFNLVVLLRLQLRNRQLSPDILIRTETAREPHNMQRNRKVQVQVICILEVLLRLQSRTRQ